MKTHLKNILIIGIVAGTADALSAVLIYSMNNPGRLFQFIASGAIGAAEAFTGGAATIILGVVFHYMIATFWSALFYLAAPKIYSFSRNRFLHAIVYGLLVWIVMNGVVIPLSKIPRAPFDADRAALAAMILIWAIGIPVAFLTAYYRKNLRV